MPDGGVFDPKVIDEITREIKGLGDNWKGLSESMATDLAAVRRLAEETKGAVGPEVKAQMDALTTSVTEKHAALETKFSARLTTLETKANRHGLGGGFSEAQDKAAAGRKRFHIQTLAGRGQLKAGIPVKDDEIDFKAIEEYEDTFPTYLRRDERGVETKALQVGSDPDGGYWVPDAMSNRIVTQVFESSPIRQLATVETISTDALEVPNDLGEVAAGWVGEQEARPETATPQTGVLRIPAHEMYAQPKATQKLLEDASINVETWLSNKISDKFGRLEATAFMVGTGVKMPRGLLTYPAGTANPGQIEQIHSGDANLVTADSLIRISFSVKEPYMANARFLMQRSAVASVMLLKDTQQRYLWQPSYMASQPASLVGYPIAWAADMPAIAAGATPIAFGDFRQAYTIVDRLGISTLRDPFTAKPFVLFYTRRRVGGDVVNFEAYKLLLIGV
jgi:HK97 family phage major capsid protein